MNQCFTNVLKIVFIIQVIGPTGLIKVANQMQSPRFHEKYVCLLKSYYVYRKEREIHRSTTNSDIE